MLNRPKIQTATLKTADPPKEPEQSSGEELLCQRPFFSFTTFLQQCENPQILDWVFKREIGKGSMCHVFLAQNVESGQLAAAKVYSKGLLLRQMPDNGEPPSSVIKKEIKILGQLSHPYILPILEAIEDEFSNSVIIFMLYAEKGSLRSRMGNSSMPEEFLSVCFFQIAEALQFIHSNNVVHLNVTPDNIYIFSDTLFKLSDFSMAKVLSSAEECINEPRAPSAYISPEECKGAKFLPKPTDVWSFGITLYYAAFNQLPFSLDRGRLGGSTIFSISQLLSTEELSFAPNIHYSEAMLSLIRRLLIKDPASRPTFDDIVKDKWFEKARAFGIENHKKYEEEIQTKEKRLAA